MEPALAHAGPRARLRFAALALIVIWSALRLAHVRLLWADEDYHLAAALQMLHGKLPYRDFWYDKPPLSAFFYLLAGAHAGWPLRLLDTAYVLAACALIYQLAKSWWSEIEGWCAALLLAFFLAFYLPSAVISFAADGTMLVPHIAAVYCAVRRRPVLSGICCAIAFLANAKALFVLAVVVLWLPSSAAAIGLGFVLPLLLLVPVAKITGCWSGYVEQVWRWGWLYAAGSPVDHPWALGFRRTLDWLGFHALIAAGTGVAICQSARRDRWRLLTWIALSFCAVSLGTRFAPHYFLQLLPPVVLAGARGLVLAWQRPTWQARRGWVLGAAAALLIVPLVRFGPRYVSLAWNNLQNRPPQWSDVTLDLDSQSAAERIRLDARPGDTLFVWGYRPDLYVFARLVSDGLFWDSQPLTGVPADRHLHESTAIYSAPAARTRVTFAQTRPTYFVDGLSPINPSLAPARYPELAAWLSHYRLIARTRLCLIYRRVDMH
jgi:hypothetical protein